MPHRVVCQNCGESVLLPEGYARAKIRCPGCGYYAEVPPNLRTADPPPDRMREDDPAFAALTDDSPPQPPLARKVPQSAPPPKKPVPRAKPSAHPDDPRPSFESDEPSGPPLLAGSQDHDEDAYGEEVQPYAVPGTGTQPCPHCRGQLPLDATLCVHCGKDVATGVKVKRKYQRIDRTWEEGWPWMLRMQIFIGLQVVNVIAAALLVATGSGLATFTNFTGLVTLISANAIQIALQGFLMGTYDTLLVTRSEKGKSSVVRFRRLFFVPLAPTKLSWRNSHAIGIAGTDIGLFAKILCLYFMFEAVIFGLAGVFYAPASLGLAAIYAVTAAGFYWVVIRPTRFEINLCDVHGSANENAFRSESRDQAEEIATTIAEATGLMYKPAI